MEANEEKLPLSTGKFNPHPRFLDPKNQMENIKQLHIYMWKEQAISLLSTPHFGINELNEFNKILSQLSTLFYKVEKENGQILIL